MKSNLKHIFDKITRGAASSEEWRTLEREGLIALAVHIGAADRGVQIAADKAALVAEAVMAARADGCADVRRIRATLEGEEHVENLSH
ncbi:hypothetical protein [Pseudoduganella buxea]|uniref:Uncharacterized protein n=1 Tax=Pseudoduganella buxea TaxID=1949069 RepID=A0A6I3SZ26_9BURK|nr:hypothetical protein [Pseudoduganella buxea]MTV54518.1 hypothetical protein [Pseudoduganella buxea]GGC10548.1 hypothetical protein GCM10011572_34980 [Pseudoduganella buxea]